MVTSFKSQLNKSFTRRTSGHCLGTFQTAKLYFDYTPLQNGSVSHYPPNFLLSLSLSLYGNGAVRCFQIRTILIGCVALRGIKSASELYRPSDLRLLAKLVSTFTDRGCRVVNVTDHTRCFLNSSCYFILVSSLIVLTRLSKP
jgi:hypothetical protein